MKNLGLEKFAKHIGTVPQILKSADYDDSDVQYVSGKPTIILKRMIDISLAKEKLGFEPKVFLQHGTYKTVQWYKEYYKKSSREDKK